MTIKEGTRLDRYEIRSKIGEGGMGEVYLAHDTKLNRNVAIKFLPIDSIGSEHANKRLLREARAAATLDHPNICAVHEVAEKGGRSFIVMQYVKGETLDLLMREKHLDFSASLSIAIQVADALAEAHAHGIIHRDIKPSNIMITPRGQPKVMDFGLAKTLEAAGASDTEAVTKSLLTTPGMIVGTVPYMSPEQVRSEKVDARTDIFGFGAMLYEMITGHQPFAAKTTVEIVEEYLKTYSTDEGGNVTSVKAMLLAKAGKEREAEETIQHAIEIGKNFGHFHHTAYNIASAYALLIKPEQAIKWLQTAADDEQPTLTEETCDR